MADESKYPTRIAPYGLRMPDDLKTRIQAAAEANGRSMNAEIVDALENRFPSPERIVEVPVAVLLELMEAEQSASKLIKGAALATRMTPDFKQLRHLHTSLSSSVERFKERTGLTVETVTSADTSKRQELPGKQLKKMADRLFSLPMAERRKQLTVEEEYELRNELKSVGVEVIPPTDVVLSMQRRHNEELPAIISDPTKSPEQRQAAKEEMDWLYEELIRIRDIEYPEGPLDRDGKPLSRSDNS